MISPNRLLHQAARGVEAAVLEGRADQRLERVGQDRGALRAAAARLAFAQAQQLGQAELQARRGAGCPRGPGGRGRG